MSEISTTSTTSIPIFIDSNKIIENFSNDHGDAQHPKNVTNFCYLSESGGSPIEPDTFFTFTPGQSGVSLEIPLKFREGQGVNVVELRVYGLLIEPSGSIIPISDLDVTTDPRTASFKSLGFSTSEFILLFRFTFESVTYFCVVDPQLQVSGQG